MPVGNLRYMGDKGNEYFLIFFSVIKRINSAYIYRRKFRRIKKYVTRRHSGYKRFKRVGWNALLDTLSIRNNRIVKIDINSLKIVQSSLKRWPTVFVKIVEQNKS